MSFVFRSVSNVFANQRSIDAINEVLAAHDLQVESDEKVEDVITDVVCDFNDMIAKNEELFFEALSAKMLTSAITELGAKMAAAVDFAKNELAKVVEAGEAVAAPNGTTRKMTRIAADALAIVGDPASFMKYLEAQKKQEKLAEKTETEATVNFDASKAQASAPTQTPKVEDVAPGTIGTVTPIDFTSPLTAAVYYPTETSSAVNEDNSSLYNGGYSGGAGADSSYSSSDSSYSSDSSSSSSSAD